MKDKIIEILRLCTELNPTETRKELTGDKPAVSFQFSGQIGCCGIQVCPNGWSFDEPGFEYMYFFYLEENGVAYRKEWGEGRETHCTIDDVIEDLKRLKEES